ncbi:MAG: nucleoid occlusion factor SlmA [Methylophilaceae bacterium]|nr:nucleoid occlusion factor SlmA [Methylophilaceae bacterium]MDG1444794.1 nucleoid occlusion factor SlmA [Methylophilaceae bacterium]MDG1821197.1 nucleoid occlusion factor SlmA [Methylophilaceae bacterium]MDG2293924.1 nucleoid occlusion factor SlmA [Methylophilaceae bacterium]
MAGERKQQILEALAKMLESPKREKITTAALAAKLGVSEAALYRHFATKAQMFESLIEFIEVSIFGVINKITIEEEDGGKQILLIVSMLLRFAEKNPGMTRVLIGDALVNENERLQERINQLYDRIEVSLKQCLKLAAAESDKKVMPESQANMMLCFVIGRWHQYAKSGFKRKPLEYVQQQLASMI